MADVQQGHGWWQASDGRWYPPETHPGYPEMVLRQAEGRAARAVLVYKRMTWALLGAWLGTALGMLLFTPRLWVSDVLFGGIGFGAVAFGVAYGLAVLGTRQR